jgi:hypothetical protein
MISGRPLYPFRRTHVDGFGIDEVCKGAARLALGHGIGGVVFGRNSSDLSYLSFPTLFAKNQGDQGKGDPWQYSAKSCFDHPKVETIHHSV